MTPFDEALWDHLVEHHGADRAQVRATPPVQPSRRPVVIGIAATGLAAAGVATVLATSSHSGSTAAGGPSPSGSGRPAHPITAGSGGPTKGVDAAYVVKRVKAAVADEVSQHNTATRTKIYRSGELSSNGTLLNLGPKSYDDSGFTAPDGVEYYRATWYAPNGSKEVIVTGVRGPVVNGKQSLSEISIDPVNHTYSQSQTDGSLGVGKAASADLPDLGSSVSLVQQSLQNGRLTLLGTVMFNGKPAIALATNGVHYQSILYVDPQTYGPVGQAGAPDPDNPFAKKLGLQVDYWVPVTPNTIAMAKDDSIPAGYTKVSEQAIVGRIY